MTFTANEFKIDAANFEWYNYTFEITLLTTVVEEHAWFNYTSFEIKYVRPPCEVSQSMIDGIAGGLSIELKAVRGLS